MWRRGPGPEEEARGQEQGAEDHGRQPGFGGCGAGVEVCAVGVQGVECVEEGGGDYADGYGEEGEGGFALLEMSLCGWGKGWGGRRTWDHWRSCWKEIG